MLEEFLGQQGGGSNLHFWNLHDWRSSKRKSRNLRFGFFERMAATYSRRTYRTTTIGNAAFDGRVRNGIGSDHSFKATKKLLKINPRAGAGHRSDSAFL